MKQTGATIIEKTLQARWESKSGKHWVELYSDRYGCTYTSPDAGGNLGNITVLEAIIRMESKVQSGYFQPDAAKTLMQRVV